MNEPLSQHAPFAVEVDGVEKSFPNGLRALGHVSLSIREGEFVTLVGPSGCGKSTLLRLIAGLIQPSAGKIRLSDGAQASGIGFVFQSPTLMPWASVERNVRLPLDLDGVAHAQSTSTVERVLSLVGLDDFAHAYPRELSGGMQMRVSIARALVTKPKLLLMDEPFGALDEITRNRLDRDLSSLCAKEGLTVLLVTHSIYEATFLSSRVLVMSARPGQIADDVRLDQPLPRDESFRGTDAFVRTSTLLSAALARAMDRSEQSRRTEARTQP